MKKIIILGSTGSIGTQALNIIKEFNDFEVVALCCDKNVSVLEKEIDYFKPKYVSVNKDINRLKEKYPSVEFFSGIEGIINIINKSDAEVVLNALVGTIGVTPTLEAIKNNKKVLLSNKETLVVAGDIVKEYLKKYNGTLYPIDSEHSGLWELIDEYKKENIKEYYITASGGAFRDKNLNELENVSKSDALKHPNWNMGEKITIDSTTMMNKVFEVMEAHYLFDIDIDKVNVRVDRSSHIHAFVKLNDGRIRCAFGDASMRNPIIRALYYPSIRYDVNIKEMDNNLNELDTNKYPLFNIGLDALKKKDSYPFALTTLNDYAVNLFLNDKIKYLEIKDIITEGLSKFNNRKFDINQMNEIKNDVLKGVRK